MELMLLYFCSFVGGVPFVLWSVVVKLLCDDEPVVREQMALGFSMLSKRVPPSSLGRSRLPHDNIYVLGSN